MNLKADKQLTIFLSPDGYGTKYFPLFADFFQFDTWHVFRLNAALDKVGNAKKQVIQIIFIQISQLS